MIDPEEVIKLHGILIEKFGGSKGLRDEGAMLAAIARPYMSFDMQDLYPTPAEKAAAIFESIIINHPFIDGNKRTAYMLLRITLHTFKHDVDATKTEKIDMALAASRGDIRFEEIRDWIESKLVTRQ